MSSHSCILCGKKKDMNVHLFKFPKNKERCKLWLQKCGLAETTETNNAYLCIRHFKDSDFTRHPDNTNIKRLRLKTVSIPSAFDFQNENEETMECMQLHNKTPSMSCILCGFVKNTTDKISYFRFPKNEPERKKWKDHFQIDDSVNLNNIRICSKHFVIDDHSSIHRWKKKRFAESSVNYSTIKKHVRPKNIDLSADEDESYTEDLSSTTHVPTEMDNMIVETDQPSFVNILSSTFSHDDCENLIVNPDMPLSATNNSSGFESGGNEGNYELTVDGTEIPFSENLHSSVIESDINRKNASTQTWSHDIDSVTDKPCTSFTATDISSDIVMKKTPPICSTAQIMETPKFIREHSYGRKTKNKLYSQPRYPEDICTPHIQTPRIARKSLTIMRNHWQKQKMVIKTLRQRLRRSYEKIDNLESLVTNLKSSHFVNEDVAQLLVVSDFVTP